jgi:hypothetical protein
MVKKMRDVDGLSSAVIWGLIEERANDLGIQIPAGTREQIFGPRPTGQGRIRPLDVAANGESELRADGQIMEVNNQVNFFRRFNIVDNALGRAVLGDLVNEPYVEIKLREDADEETGFSNQYTFFVRRALFAPLGLRQNSRARAILSTLRVSGYRVWVAESIDHPW